MRTDDFDFPLPEHLIAQHPLPRRDQSRLLVLQRDSGQTIHHPTFTALLQYLRPGDLLVLNNTRVLPSRLRAQKKGSGGSLEILLVEEVDPNHWWVLLRPGKRVRVGTPIEFTVRPNEIIARAAVQEKDSAGRCLLSFSDEVDVRDLLERFGEVPLPPYIDRPAQTEDRERYQTVFARVDGSIAAPTAGLHLTRELLGQIEARGVEVHALTLHVGPGTFTPVKTDILEAHRMHAERFALDQTTATAINAARRQGRRVIAVGTTTVRVLESVAARRGGELVEEQGWTDIYIYPPYPFQIVDALITNFHLPRSTLLMLVSAFLDSPGMEGRKRLLEAYAEAIRLGYRFFSYGDAMLIL